MNRDVEKLTNEAIELVRRIGAHASDVATQHEAQIDELRKASRYYAGQIAELVSDDHASAVATDNALAERDKRIAELEAENTRLATTCDENARLAVGYSSRVTTLERELKESRENAETALSRLRDRVIVLECRLVESNKRAATAESMAADKVLGADEECRHANVELDRALSRITTLERELAAKTMEAAALREELAVLKDDLNRAYGDHTGRALVEERDALREELAATKATLARALDEEALEVVEADECPRQPCPSCDPDGCDAMDAFDEPTVEMLPRKAVAE